MEIDILNDILTKTVSNLFTNKAWHISYFSYDSDNESQSLHNTIISTTSTQKPVISQPQKQTHQHYQHQQIKPNEKKETTLCTPEWWKSSIGRKKFEESMKRLGVDEHLIKSKPFLRWSLEKWTEEKGKVKNELKQYDMDYQAVFNVMPSRHDKEILKPWYVYYKALKNAIDTREKPPKDPLKNQAQQIYYPNTWMNNNNVNDDSIANHSIITNISTKTNTTVNSHSNMRGNSNPSAWNNQHTTNWGNNNTNNQVVVNKKIITTTQQGANKNPQMKRNVNNTPTQEPVTEKKRTISKAEADALEQEYYALKKEQNELKNKLHNYQSEFKKNNNRAVKFLKDISPVQKEYKKYKVNKDRLKVIKDFILENSLNMK